MDAHNGPLLLLVQANITPDQEDAFNSWYYHHVPKLLEVPGWLWGRRYVGVKGDTKYLALYAVETMDAMARVMAWQLIRNRKNDGWMTGSTRAST